MDRRNRSVASRSSNKRSSASFALIVGAVLSIAILQIQTAEARPRPAGKSKKAFKANKTFGLGFMLGAPTGLSGKYFVGKDTALDFGVGTIYGYRDREGFHLHGDFLWHPMSLGSPDAFEVPLYFGVGGRFLSGRRCYRYDVDRDRRYCDYYYGGYTAVGVRGPIGIALDFNRVPLDIFFELVPVLDVVVDRDDRFDDALYFDVNGAIGLRYYFN